MAGGESFRLSPPPDNVCVCFRVPLQKIVKFVRLENPSVPSQISECYGAGTGCGWCIPFLERVFEELKANPDIDPEIGLSGEEYLARRKEYHLKINAAKMRDQRKDEG
ncbi:hypothetical protein BH09SUM1_BH09SUM1_32830 [soil metagenome]